MHAVLIHLTELHGQNDLGELGEHAEEGGNPHPEHRAGSAGEDGPGDAGDVAGAHGGGQGGGHRLKGGEVFAVALAALLLFKERPDGVAPDVAEFGQLDTAGADGEIGPGADQQDQHDGSPDHVVDGFVDAVDNF